MTPESVMSLGYESMKVALAIAAPLLLTSLFTGLLVSILQASTQLNESTLSFIPKIIALVLVLIVLGPWMLETLMDYMRSVFLHIPTIIR